MTPVLSPRLFGLELKRLLDSVNILDANGLADLFRDANTPTDYGTSLRHTLQNFLLIHTINHARTHTKFYKKAEYADWRPVISDRVPELDTVPVLRRATVIESFEEFLSDDVELRSICHTSGVSGSPLDIYKSHQEIDFIQRYYRRLLLPVAQTLKVRPLTLSLPNTYHGVPVPLPSIGMTFVGGVTDDTLIRDTCRVLQTEFNIRGHDSRISLLGGLSFHVLFLTSYLLEQGINLRDLNFTSVTSTGGYVPMVWIQFLKDAWGCFVNDRFTLTEAIGGASRLYDTDTFELDSHIIGEILDPVTERAADIGLLVLTNLYPFVQMQPFIRYTIGDLVRRVPSPGPFRFQFLGKVQNCISWDVEGRSEWLLFSARLNELLHELPDCNVYEWFSNVRVVSDRSFGSQPIVSVEVKNKENVLNIRISAELRYAPHTRGARIDELRQKITDGLRSTPGTTLASRMDSNEVVLEIVFLGPGALKAPLVVKI